MEQNMSIGVEGCVTSLPTDRDGGGRVESWGRSQRNNRLKNDQTLVHLLVLAVW